MFFHRRTLERRRSHLDVKALLADECFLVYLYATLTAWGMHRMGRGGTKLTDFEEFAGSIRGAESSLARLADTKMTEIDPSEAVDRACAIWSVLATLRVSRSAAKLVAGSKALHHILPDLVPPMDREHTLVFCYGRKRQLAGGGEREFLEMFPVFCQIARDRRGVIEALLDDRFNTSTTKVVDNAVVGYVVRHLK